MKKASFSVEPENKMQHEAVPWFSHLIEHYVEPANEMGNIQENETTETKCVEEFWLNEETSFYNIADESASHVDIPVEDNEIDDEWLCESNHCNNAASAQAKRI